MSRYKCVTYAVLLVLAILAPLVLRNEYLRHLLVMTGIFAILALSLDIIMGYMGQFSFGHAAFFGIGAYTAALLSVKLGVPAWLCFPAAVAVSGAFGLSIGYVCLRARAWYLAIVTMGFGWILWTVVSHWYDVTGGATGVSGIAPVALPGIVFQSELSYYYLVLALVILVMYLINSLLRSRLGRAIIAVRENEELACSIGISPFRCYVVAFTLATALAGLAGATYAHYIQFVCPEMLSMYYMFIMLIMVLVGGTATLPGPVIGAAIFVFMPEVLRMTEEFRLLIFGVVVLVCIIFMRQGIYPSLVALWNRVIVRRTWA